MDSCFQITRLSKDPFIFILLGFGSYSQFCEFIYMNACCLLISNNLQKRTKNGYTRASFI